VSFKYLRSVAVGVLLASLVIQTARAHIGEVAPFASPSTRSVDPRVEALAKRWFFRFQTGDIDRSQLDQRVDKQLTSTMIKQEEKTLQAYGCRLAETLPRTRCHIHQPSGADGFGNSSIVTVTVN
jgi:hypothetical protein